METLAADVDERLLTAEDDDDRKKFTILSKKLHVILDATAQYRATGDASQEYSKLYDELEHFMQMEPVCSNPLPWWMNRQRQEIKID